MVLLRPPNEQTPLAFQSQYLSLWLGDIIATGSPPGTALEMGKHLKEGDVIRIEIEGVGTLENPVGPPR